MKKAKAFLLCFLGLQVIGLAQFPATQLDNWSAVSPIEKVYLHFDRDEYIAGETAWFKAYLYSEYQPDTISTSLYVELTDLSSRVLVRKVLPVLFGTTFGQIELKDSLSTGHYLIRAYTATMLNHDQDFLFNRDLFIYGKKNSSPVPAKPKQKRLEFFPEGGNFIDGSLNTVAFKATDENGLPVPVSGKIYDQKNEVITSFETYHDGMGMFDINAEAGARFYAVLDDMPSKKYDLPEPVKKGIVFRLMPDPQGRYYEIIQKTNDNNFQAAYLVGQMQHHVVFKQDLSSDKDWLTGVINTSRLFSGILQITIFNKAGMPLAERLTFINNKEYQLPAKLSLDTLNFSPNALNQFSLSLKDTIIGSFSVSVTDPTYEISQLRSQHIYSNLLLTSDIKGYVHNPAWYFSAPDDSSTAGIDLVMMTNGWRRFKWNQLTDQPAALLYKDPHYISLSGQVNIRDTKKPLPDRELIVMIARPDSLGNSIEMMTTDSKGRFRLDSLIFFDKASFLVSDIRGRKSKWLDVYPDTDSAMRSFSLQRTDLNSFAWKSFESDSSGLASKLAYDYDAIQKASGLMLEGVTVKVKKKTPIQELEEKYASGLFSGANEKTIDLVNNKEADIYANIFDYLQARVPGLSIFKDGLDYYIYYRQSVSISSMGGFPMTLFLDEMQTDASVISTIGPQQVAMVKIFSNFVGASGGGPGGVLAIYTKKGADLSSVVFSSADNFSYMGYSLVKEFYSPEYKANNTSVHPPDNRITLQWLPDIFVSSVDPRIPIRFYNNDRSKSYRVIVEGMTWDGRLLFFEKTITPGQKPF